MLQPIGGGNATRSQGYINSWHLPRAVNSASYMPTERPRAAKRQLNGPASELEPAIKQERLDPGYDRAMVQPSGAVLGSIMPMTTTSLPRQVTVVSTAQPTSMTLNQPVQILPRPQRIGAATRQNKLLNIGGENHRNNTTFGGPVVLLRPGVAVPFLTPDLMTVPNPFGTSARRVAPLLPPISPSSGSINGHNNRASNQHVVFVPRSTVAVPRQSSLPTFLQSRPIAVPNVCVSGHGQGLVSVPTSSTTPLLVIVSRPSTTGARIVCTGTSLASTVMTSSVNHTTVRAHPSAPQANNSKPLAEIKAIVRKRVLKKYVGPHVPPADLHMPACTKHSCQQCGDEFVTEVGLESHMSRRSMLISFSCTSYTLQQQFYNPCAFQNFYRAHCFHRRAHSSSDSIVVSALDLDTTECQPRMNQQTDNAGNVGQSSENSNTAQRPTTASDSNLNLQSAVSAVKEIYVNLEVEPDKHGNEQISENSAKHSSTATAKKTKNSVVKPASAAKSGLPKSKLVGDTSLRYSVEDFSNAVCHNRAKCPECLLDCKTRQQLSAHFLVSSGKEPLRCTDCGLTLPTVCSFSAHMRLHKNLSPFVCPQCGIVFDEAESVEVFRAHVERYCFHLMQTSSSTSVSNCPWCNFTETDKSKMVRHFIDLHAAVYYKCRSCPKAFVNDSAAKRHSENTGHDAHNDTVHKCASCDAVFKDSAENEMESHVTEHFAPSVQCPICTVTASRQSVVEHLHSCHPNVILPATTCEVCGQPQASQKELFTHVTTKHITYYESLMKSLPCAAKKSALDMECESHPQSEPSPVVGSEEVMHVSQSEVPTSVIVSPVSSASTISVTESATVPESDIQSHTPLTEEFQCSRCQMTFSSKDTYKRHKAKHRFLEAKKARKKQAATKPYEDPLEQVPTEKHKICVRCSQTFDNAETLNQHITTVHRAPDWHLCHLCADCFSTRNHLEQHVELQHRGKTVESSLAYVCALCAESSDSAPVSYTVQGMLTKHLRNVHGVPRIAAANMARAAAPSTHIKSAYDSDKAPDSPGISSSKIEPVRRLFISGETTSYQCSRCNFSAEDRAEFVVHASEHSPAVAGAVQCKECAASFTVAPALYRHLRITHRMNCDIDTYLQENGYATAVTRSVTPDLVLTVDAERLAPITSPSSSSPVTPSGGHDSESSTETTVKVTTPQKADDDDDSPGECTVCYRVFTTKHLLRAHMRVHGMAFIQRTRRRLSLNTSPV